MSHLKLDLQYRCKAQCCPNTKFKFEFTKQINSARTEPLTTALHTQQSKG